MKKSSFYVCLTIGGVIALLLSVAGVAAPAATASVLPIGGTDFHQFAIVTLVAVAVATLIDLFWRN